MLICELETGRGGRGLEMVDPLHNLSRERSNITVYWSHFLSSYNRGVQRV